MLTDLMILLFGFGILIKSSDIFVDALSSIATHFKISKILIALTLAAFGTCAPELSISFNSMVKGNGDILIANVIGSCIVNVLLIIGISSFFFPIKIKNNTVKKEIPLLFISTTLLVFSLLGNFTTSSYVLTRIDGILFFIFFIAFLFYLISLSKIKNTDKSLDTPKYSIKMSVFLSVVCIFFIIIGSNLVVEKAIWIAQSLNISAKFITMTVIVIGTSLPEMTMTVIAAKKREFDISIGNIIGTNIFNIGVVLGIPIMIYGGIESSAFHYVDVVVLFLSGFIFYLVSKNDRVISRREGMLMILVFLLYYTYLAIF